MARPLAVQTKPDEHPYYYHVPKCRRCGKTDFNIFGAPPNEWICVNHDSGMFSGSAPKTYAPHGDKCSACGKSYGLLTSHVHCMLCGRSLCKSCVPSRRAVPEAWHWTNPLERYRCCRSCFHFYPHMSGTGLASSIAKAMNLNISDAVIGLGAVGDVLLGGGVEGPVGAALVAFGGLLKVAALIENSNSACMQLAQDMCDLVPIIQLIQNHQSKYPGSLHPTAEKLIVTIQEIFDDAHGLFLVFTQDEPNSTNSIWTWLKYKARRVRDWGERIRVTEGDFARISERIDNTCDQMVLLNTTLTQMTLESMGTQLTELKALVQQQVNSTQPPSATIVLLVSSRFDKYPPRFSCSAEVAIERVAALNKIRDAFANKNDDRLVLLYGPHGVGKTIAAAQYCKHRKRQQQSDKKNIIAAQVQASTLRESLRDMFDIPIDSDKITFEDIRNTMDAIYDRLPADDENTRICLLVDDLSCTDEETVKNLVFLSKSKLIDGIVATVPTESTPKIYDDCQRVQMTAFSVDETIHLSRNVLGGATADATTALLQQRGVDKNSAQALLDACDKKPFLVHRALEQFNDNLDPKSVKLADFIAKKLTPQTLESSARDRYEHTLKSISTLQIDAFRKHFKTPADAAVTPLEALLTACKKLQIQQFDMQFLRLVLRVEGGGSSSNNDAKLTEWIKWMKSNIGLVHNLADSTFKLHYLQSIGNPLFDGAMDWEHAAVLCQAKESYDDALKHTAAWISSKPDDELQVLDKLTIAFCIVARTCGLYRSNPTEAPTEKALSLWQQLEAAWKADKLPQGTSAEIAALGAAGLSKVCFYDAKYQDAADLCAVALSFKLGEEEVRADLLNTRGMALEQMGKREEGVALKKEALRMRRLIHGGVDDLDVAVAVSQQPQNYSNMDHPDVANSLNNVGYSLEQMGKREEGFALKNEALEMRRRIYRGVDHPDLAASLNNVGISLEGLGKRQEGLDHKQKALEMHRRIHRGVDYPDVADSLNNVGISLEQMGKREEGLALKKEALEMRRRIYPGVDHPDLAASLNNVGNSLDRMGKHEEGLARVKEALEMRRRIYPGVDHPDVAQSLNNVGLSHFQNGEFKEGIGLQQEALAMHRRIHQDVDHPDVASSLNNVGDSLMQMDGKHDEGVALMNKALEMYRRLRDSGGDVAWISERVSLIEQGIRDGETAVPGGGKTEPPAPPREPLPQDGETAPALDEAQPGYSNAEFDAAFDAYDDDGSGMLGAPESMAIFLQLYPEFDVCFVKDKVEMAFLHFRVTSDGGALNKEQFLWLSRQMSQD